ncbi:MAG: hypothetical protein K5769_02740 [Pseudobutyrivibrio sp.]|nr:hypothetical protein [Pseudobutyrivibrio sp.]
MFDKVYVFRGKHATMVETLTNKLSDQIGMGFFKTNYDVYRVAPIIGYIYRRTAEPDKADNTTKIFYDKLANEKDDLIFNYRTLMMLLNNDMTEDEKLDVAFRLDEKNEERKVYDDLYDSYVLGGVEEMYEQIIGDGKSVDEYIMNLFDFLEDLNMRLYGGGITKA